MTVLRPCIGPRVNGTVTLFFSGAKALRPCVYSHEGRHLPHVAQLQYFAVHQIACATTQQQHTTRRHGRMRLGPLLCLATITHGTHNSGSGEGLKAGNSRSGDWDGTWATKTPQELIPTLQTPLTTSRTGFGGLRSFQGPNGIPSVRGPVWKVTEHPTVQDQTSRLEHCVAACAWKKPPKTLPQPPWERHLNRVGAWTNYGAVVPKLSERRTIKGSDV